MWGGEIQENTNGFVAVTRGCCSGEDTGLENRITSKISGLEFPNTTEKRAVRPICAKCSVFSRTGEGYRKIKRNR